ncbi:hypothetical protein GWK47_043536 [Chionoecetes opilio]|uniref:Uncharacterized protein n=1 Tax=Chionoecetes opilio TaxID=41210 RepID=A0A8J4YGV9_CHIOP|nr:hypothetical protein GWK47_043536 [Chionoecetes opilio]
MVWDVQIRITTDQVSHSKRSYSISHGVDPVAIGAGIRRTLEAVAKVGRKNGVRAGLERLDAVQRRALRLVGIEEDQHSSAGVTSLEHRRDVSALVVCHKAQVQEVPHLSSLRLPPRAVQRWSRTTPLSDVLVRVPLSHSRQHQRTYTARTSRLWNMFAAATPDVQNMSTHQVKLAAQRWHETKTSPLVM